MADFIAVIRRAVDGLTENTPEMRVKVYERARGAVQRQLENMKPRPPEAMLLRQLDKLEAAIREVEAEHAEAGPAEETVEAAGVSPPLAVPVPEPVVEEPAAEETVAEEQPTEAEAPAPVHEEPAHYEEPVAAQEEPAAPHYEEPVSHHEEPAFVEPEQPAEQHEPWKAEEEPAAEEEVHPAEQWQAEHPEEIVHVEQHGREEPLFETEAPATEPEPVQTFHEELVHEEPAHEEPVHQEPAFEEPAFEEPVSQPAARDYDLNNRLVEPVFSVEAPAEFVDHSQAEPLHADAAGHFDPVWNEPAAEAPAPAERAAETDWALEELRQFSETAPVTPTDKAARAFEDAIAGLEQAQTTSKMPAANEAFSWEAAAFDDLPAIDNTAKAPARAVFDDSDLMSEVHGTQKATQPAPADDSDDWREVTALRGYDNRTAAANDDNDGIPPASLGNDISSKFEGKNFRMEPKRRRFGLGAIIGSLVALGVIGGGAYAAWTNQDALTDMVKGLVSAAPSQTASNGQQTPATPQAQTPAASTDAGVAKPAEENKEVASLNDGSSVSNKFNQRLMADGTEVDSGPAAVPGTPTAEGKSVAQQNVAASTSAPASTPGTEAVPPATTPAVSGEAVPAAATPTGASEKMFLYEERIGQSSPTAIQGSVVWSVQHEAGENGKQESTVQGIVTVPERNLSAQVTFKRNGDASLPASHIVEIVFSLPANFEGGAIESVQRISMKRTEQDRGDQLIAVPAKITDDFHMIALNDYPDARKSNLDLLATRDWIDIPVTYRNGRRALLTMQKGATGTEAFNTAIKDWAALGDVSTSQ